MSCRFLVSIFWIVCLSFSFCFTSAFLLPGKSPLHFPSSSSSPALSLKNNAHMESAGDKTNEIYRKKVIMVEKEKKDFLPSLSSFSSLPLLSKVIESAVLTSMILSLSLVAEGVILPSTMNTSTMNAVIVNAAESSKPSASEYEKQIVAGYDELEKLYKRWDKLDDHGDAVRRYLGTVGTKSPLFKIDRAFRCIREDIFSGDEKYADLDALEFAEQSQAILDGIKNTDFLAYSSIFSSYGNGGDDINLVNQSKEQVVETMKLYKDLLQYMHLQK